MQQAEEAKAAAQPAFHEVSWTPDQIKRFWNFHARNVTGHESFFSYVHAGAILKLARRYLRRDRMILDLGCGPGYLTGALLSEGFQCTAVDSSPESVRFVSERYDGDPRFEGASVGGVSQVPFDDGTVGTVFLIEVLEHLTDEEVAASLEECRRILTRGGHVVITVPHAEDLALNLIACPECAGVFHRVQHLQSYSIPRMRQLLEAHGLAPRFVKAVHFGVLGSWSPLLLARRIYRYFSRVPDPHLIAIAKRS